MPPVDLPVALVGVGRWGAHILRDLRTLGCDVHAVARSAASVGRATEGGAASVVASVEELPPDLRAVVVATPTATHAEVVGRVAGAFPDVPIAVEKPLTDDLDAAERLAAAHGERVFVLDKWRYHPCVEEIARIARAGELGAVRSMHSRRVTDMHRHADVDTVWVHLPHDLAIALEILGTLPEPAWAVEERDGRGERVGLLCALGGAGAPSVTAEVSCIAPAHRRELRVLFDGGVCLLDGAWTDELLVRRAGAAPETRTVPGELPLLAELRAFLAHARGEAPPPRSSAAEGVEIVRLVQRLGELAAAHGTALDEARA